MKRILFLLALSAFTFSCVRVPITNRKQLNLIAETELMGMSDSLYTQFLTENKVVDRNDPRTKRVKEVGNKIKAEVELFLKKNNASNRVEGFEWEFNLVEDKTVNAWCMPGGKVVVYTGILDLAESDDELAVIMGHEIAHAIARHGNERMSNAIALQGIGGTLGAVMGADPTAGQNLFLQSYGIASALGSLKFSRKHESESDKLGLVFMSLAGYNPAKAVDFWEKMSQNGASAPELLSTHPSDETRIKDIKEFLPEIPKYTKGVH
jgi:predicted Zn-dependent protease